MLILFFLHNFILYNLDVNVNKIFKIQKKKKMKAQMSMHHVFQAKLSVWKHSDVIGLKFKVVGDAGEQSCHCLIKTTRSTVDRQRVFAAVWQRHYKQTATLLTCLMACFQPHSPPEPPSRTTSHSATETKFFVALRSERTLSTSARHKSSCGILE